MDCAKHRSVYRKGSTARSGVPRHDVAVAARCEAAVEALEGIVRGGQAEHLHLREGSQVEASGRPSHDLSR